MHGCCMSSNRQTLILPILLHTISVLEAKLLNLLTTNILAIQYIHAWVTCKSFSIGTCIYYTGITSSRSTHAAVAWADAVD